MKNFLNKNKGTLIAVGVVLVVGLILAIAIIISTTERVEKYVLSQDNLIQYNGVDENIVIDDKVISIGQSVFASKTSITKVTFEKKSKLSSIGHSAFEGCLALKEITLPSTLKSIGYGAFKNCASLESIVIPEGVTSIEGHAFDGCIKLKSITLPSTLTTLGEGVFDGCDALEVINSSSAAIKVENGVLFNGTTLVKVLPGTQPTEYTVPSFVTRIDAYAFEYTESITKLVVGTNVEYIGNAAFIGCKAIAEIALPFVGRGDADGEGPKGFEAGLLCSLFSDSISAAPSTLVKVEVLGGKVLCADAFRNCRNIKEIILPNTLEVIEINAFQNCSKLTSIVIPESVKEINGFAFVGCTSLYIKVKCDASAVKDFAFSTIAEDRIEYLK